MARTVRPLSENQIKKAKIEEKDYKLFDGNGLFLLVKSNGSKLWRAKYRFDGKESSVSFGKYPVVSLSAARKKLEDLKEDIENGINPSKKKKEVKVQKVTAHSFKDVAKQFLEFKSHELSLDYYNQQCSRLEYYAYPVIGNIDIDSITKADMIALIKNIPSVSTPSTKNSNKSETSRKVFNLLNQVFKWALHNDLTTNAVMQTLDRNSLVIKSDAEHFKAITDIDELRTIYKMFKEYMGDLSTKNALLFITLTGLRTINIRGLRWEQVNLNKKLIIYPKEDMKTKEEFRLPVTKEMEAILEDMRAVTGKEKHVFCSTTSKSRMLSENTLGYALKRMGILNHTPHGFRSSFSTICHEKQKEHGFSSEVIETQLAHTVGSKVKQAYLRSDFLDERRELLEWWGGVLGK